MTAARRHRSPAAAASGVPQLLAAERIELVLRLGNTALDLFRSTLPRGTTRDQARRIMQRNARRGRRRSAVVESLDP